MKRKHLLWAAVAVVLLIAGIFPSVVYRARNDQKHQYYTAAVDFNSFAQVLPITKTAPLLKEFRAVGVRAVVIREKKDGYLEKFLNAAVAAEMEIILEPDLASSSLHDLEPLLEKHAIRAIKLRGSSGEKESEEKRKELCRLIRERGMTLILTETLEQVSNEHPEGFEEYLAAADGRILRSYRNGQYTTGESAEYPYAYYHHLSAALDRNIRFLLAYPLLDEGFTPDENAERMVDSMALLCKKLEEEGYSPFPSPDLNSYPSRRILPSAAVAAIMVLMAGVILELWRKKGEKWLLWGAFFGSVAAFGITLLLPESLVLLYPTGFAAFAPCFCFAFVYELLKNRKNKWPLPILLLCGCLFSAALLLLCGSCLAAMINGWDYWLNELSFRGVKFSLMAPVAFAALWMGHEAWKEWKPASLREGLQTMIKGLRWYHGLLLVAAMALAGLYLVRSGHVNAIPFWETKMRDGLTEWLLARPRTKEFLVGWPCLILLIFEIRCGKKENLLRWIFGIISAVLFASVINTFCHVFTPVEAMILRTVYGLLIGGLWGGILLIPILLIYRKLKS